MGDTVHQSNPASEMGSDSGERRAHPRTPVLETSAGIIAADLDQGDSGIILDLTPDGMMLQCLSSLSAGDSRTVTFALPGITAPLNLSAVVVWSDPEGRAGLRFHPAREDVRKQLQTWLVENHRPFFNATSPTGTAPAPLPLPPVFPAGAPSASQALSFLDTLTDASHETSDEAQRAVNAIAWTIVEEISRLTPAQGAVVAVAQGDSITCRASWGSAPGVGARLQPEVGLSGECFRTGLPILCNDAEADPRVPVAVSKRLNLKSILVVPVPGPQAPLGLLEALAGEKNAFSDSDVRILTRLAASLAEVLQSVGLQGQTGTSPVSSAGPKPGAAPVLAPNSAPAAPTSTSAHANGTQPAEAPSVSPAAVKPLTPTAPSASKPPAPAATPSRTPLSATPAGSTAAATKQQPARTAPFPAAGQPKPRQEEQEILPLASSVQAASTASAVKHGSSTRKLEPDGQPIAPGALASGPVPEAKSSTRTLAISGIAALALLAIVAVIWTLSEKQQPQPPAEPAATAAATEPATPAAETSEEQPLTPPALPEKPLSSATQPSTPAASERPRASSPPRPTRSQARESQSEQEQDDIAMYAVGSDIRRPAAVPRVRVAGEGVAPVQPPPAVGAGTASGPTLPSEPAAAPRLAVPPPPTAPQLIQRVEPVRPASARTLSGTVVLSAIIGVDGKPTDIKPVSGHPLLVGAAMNAFRNWRYEPARRNGYPIAAPIQVRFVFTAQ